MKSDKTAAIQLPVQSNPYGIPTIQDFLAEGLRLAEIETNIKNNLYSFILEHGLYDELKLYSQVHDMSSPGGHERVITGLCMKLPHFKN